jgi:hypothetical protein
MRKTTTALFGAAAAAVLAAVPLGASFAQPGPGAGGPPPGPRGPARMFEQIDADHDGRVTWEETWTFVQRRFAEADRDHDGGLTQQEMQDAIRQAFAQRRAAAAAPQGGAQQQRQQQGGPDGRRGPDFARHMGGMFRALDANRDGKVTLDEIRPFVEARFRALDANGDNVVTRDELPQPRPHRRGGPDGDRRGPPPSPPANPG